MNNKLESYFDYGRIKLIDNTENISVTYKIDQKVNFISSNRNSKLILSVGDIDEPNKLPNINVSDIYHINIEGKWSDSEMESVNNYLIIPRKPELYLNGIIKIKSEYVPFNIHGQSIEFYFSSNHTKISGKNITSGDTIIYLEHDNKMQVFVEFVKHEIGRILIFSGEVRCALIVLKFKPLGQIDFPCFFEPLDDENELELFVSASVSVTTTKSLCEKEKRLKETHRALSSETYLLGKLTGINLIGDLISK